MKIQIASDLHLEHLQPNWPGERIISPALDADVLVLAGDIADGATGFKLFSNWCNSRTNKATPIIYVAGNHEFYGHVLAPMREKMREAAAVNGIHFLENEAIEIDGVRFLGTTLWTDYRLFPNFTQQQSMDRAQRGLNDHNLIRTGHCRFSAQDALELHHVARGWLKTELAKPFAGKTVVVTHHGVHPLSVHPRYQDDLLTAAFVSDLSEHLPHIDLLCHGHVHDGVDYQVGRCRVVANPAGYILNRGWATSRESFRFENQTFNENLVVEL